MRAAQGFTLTEILVATVVVSAAMWGTMTALATAAQIRAAASAPVLIEANGYALQSIEEVRNRAPDGAWMAGQIALGWHNVGSPQTGWTRMRCVRTEDCDGDGTADDCYAVTAKVCWNGQACPVEGSSTNVCS